MKSAQPEAVAVNRINPGETLRNAREQKDLSVAEVAAQLNLTPTRLGQIEAAEFEKLPGHTFARGYVRAYAKLLGLDQAVLVEQFDQFTGSNAVGSNVQGLGRIEEPVKYSQRILRFVSFALLVGLAVVGFYWWQGQAERQANEQASSALGHVEVEGADGATQIHPLDEPEDQAVEAAQEAAPLDLGSIAPTDESEEGAPPTAAEEGEPEAAPATPNSTQDNAAQDAAVAAAPAAPAETAEAAPAPATEQPVAAAGEGNVAINFSADCWLQVTDADGKVVFSGLKRKGENLQVVGKAPLALRLGFARGAEVSYNGQPVDVTPHIANGGTARLTLGQ